MRRFFKKYGLNIHERIILKSWLILENYVNSKKTTALRSQLNFLGESTIIEPSVVFNRPDNISIGKQCFIGRNCVFDAYTSLTIGDNCAIAQDCKFITANHAKISERIPEIDDYELAPIKVGSRVWFGFNVVVLPGVEIGDNCIIGAGAVVTKTIPNNKIVGGVPARIIGDVAN